MGVHGQKPLMGTLPGDVQEASKDPEGLPEGCPPQGTHGWAAQPSPAPPRSRAEVEHLPSGPSHLQPGWRPWPGGAGHLPPRRDSPRDPEGSPCVPAAAPHPSFPTSPTRQPRAFLLQEPGPMTHPGAGPARAGGGRAEAWPGRGAVCTLTSLVGTLPGYQLKAPQADSAPTGDRAQPLLYPWPHARPHPAPTTSRLEEHSGQGPLAQGGSPLPGSLRPKIRPWPPFLPVEAPPSGIGLGCFSWGLCPHTCWELNSVQPRLPPGSQLVQTPHPAPGGGAALATRDTVPSVP